MLKVADFARSEPRYALSKTGLSEKAGRLCQDGTPDAANAGRGDEADRLAALDYTAHGYEYGSGFDKVWPRCRRGETGRPLRATGRAASARTGGESLTQRAVPMPLPMQLSTAASNSPCTNVRVRAAAML